MGRTGAIATELRRRRPPPTIMCAIHPGGVLGANRRASFGRSLRGGHLIAVLPPRRRGGRGRNSLESRRDAAVDTLLVDEQINAARLNSAPVVPPGKGRAAFNCQNRCRIDIKG